MKDYLEINRKSWNKRTDIHISSAFYDNDSFVKGRNSLNDIEMNLLGDIQGKSLLHLQCHFGQDSISLARLGANVTGVDLSDNAIQKAKGLAKDCQENVDFINSDVYDLPNHLDAKFDFVFTSYGTIGWLPDIKKWAHVVRHFLAPGGEFVFAEFHPFLWMYDDHFKDIKFKYFNSGPIEETSSGTYTDSEAPIKEDYVSWNHGLGEVISALLDEGLALQSFEEFDYSPYDCFEGTIEDEPGKFRIKKFGDNVPMVYALKMSVPDN